MRINPKWGPVLTWLVFVLGFAAVIAAIVTVGLWLGRADAAQRMTCEHPDPGRSPVIVLASGELRTLAALAWAEARGEPEPYCAMQAVAAVAVNRMRTDPRHFGATLTQVVHKPYAFTPFGRESANGRRMRKVDESDAVYVTALLAAVAAVCGADPVGGATHFHAGRAPEWAASMMVTARLGSHTFLKARQTAQGTHAE